jgi:DNA-binding IclR family transcriptional regulator
VQARVPSDEAAPGKPRIQSAARAFQALFEVAREPEGISAKLLAERMQLPRQTVYHLLHTLCEIGVVRKLPGGRNGLGLALTPLIAGFTRQFSPQDELRPLVQAVCAATGETAYAVGWVGPEVMVLATARGTNPIQAMEVPLGFCGPANSRASGKLLLALASEERRAAYLASHPPVAVNARTLVTPEALEAEFGRILAQGHAVDDEEHTEGLACLSVPFVRDQSHFALTLAAPAPRFRKHRRSYLEHMRRIAQGS